jgi:hypothetical protein
VELDDGKPASGRGIWLDRQVMQAVGRRGGAAQAPGSKSGQEMVFAAMMRVLRNPF